MTITPIHEPCSPTEQVLRAICFTKYCAETDTISRSLFEGANVSVARLAISSFAEIVNVFRRLVAKPDNPLCLVGEIGVGTLQAIGRTKTDGKGRPAPMNIQVVPEPDPDGDAFPAHAIIPQTISRGIANEIVKRLKRHRI